MKRMSSIIVGSLFAILIMGGTVRSQVARAG